jgi:hypothetical protein
MLHGVCFHEQIRLPSTNANRPRAIWNRHHQKPVTASQSMHPRPVRSLALLLEQLQRHLHIVESRAESPSGTMAWEGNRSVFSDGRMKTGHDRHLDAMIRLASPRHGQPIAPEELLRAAQV